MENALENALENAVNENGVSDTKAKDQATKLKKKRKMEKILGR